MLAFLPAGKVLPGLEERHFDLLRRELPQVDWVECGCEKEFLDNLPESRGAVAWAFLPEWLERAPGISLVCTPAAGRDWVAIRPQPGLAVAFGAFHGELIGQTVLGLLLAFARGIRDSMEMQGREPWARDRIAGRMRSLRGSHAVILGFGHIGKWIGQYLKPMGVRLTGVNRSNMARPGYFDAGDHVAAMEDLDSLLPDTDHLILALPGDSGTDGVIDARRLGLLPHEAVVYNIGRGNSIDTPALIDALENGRLAGAGLDVFDVEPLPGDAPIRHCPNVILMPHVSAFAPTYIDLYLKELLSLVRMHLLTETTGDG